jgi:hypothetical protein
MWVNSISDNTAPLSRLQLDFSVDRISTGAAGTAVNGQFNLNQQPGDIFQTQQTFTGPGNFVGLAPNAGYVGALPTAGVGGGNTLAVDESALTLTAGLGVGNLVGPAFACPAIGAGTHDNVDAFEWNAFDTTGDLLNDRWMYFSINPDEGVRVNVTAANIWDVMPQGGGTSSVMPFATAASIGLDSQGFSTDDIDALIMWDRDLVGGPMWGGPGAQAGIDYALFSLSHGSASLSLWNLTEADIFFTDFNGSFALYANAADLGLVGAAGLSAGDNVDALEAIPEPTTMVLLGLGALALIRRRRARC